MTYAEVLEALANDTMGLMTGKSINEMLKYYRQGMHSSVLTVNQIKGLKVLESFAE